MVKARRDILDPLKRGIAQIRDNTTAGQTDSFRLTEIDGIGKSTAEKLKDAGVDTAEQLARLTPNQLERIDGIGKKRADNLSRQFQYGRTRLEQPESGPPEEVTESMAERSSEARQADRSFNAPITYDAQQWKQNPDEYDYPGVDTIPTDRRADRVKKKAERGGFGIETASLGGMTQGNLAGGTARVDTGNSFDPISTAAHEIGHAAESSLGRRSELSGSLFEDDQLRSEAEDLAVRRRSMVSSAESIADAYDDQDLDSELFADAFAVATEEPRAAKRDAPNLFRELQDQTVMDFGRF